MEKYQGQAGGVSLEVRSNDESGEVCYDAAPETKLSAAALEELSQHLQDTFKNGQGSQRFIDIDQVTLEKAQSLKDWFAAIKYQPKPGEIKQEKSGDLN